MYIESLHLYNIRTFQASRLDFVHPDRKYRAKGRPAAKGQEVLLPRPRIPNVNLLLGDNGSGKSTVLRGVAMAALGPSFQRASLVTNGLVRRVAGEKRRGASEEGSHLVADLLLHAQDGAEGQRLRTAFALWPQGELEQVSHLGSAAIPEADDRIAPPVDGEPRAPRLPDAEALTQGLVPDPSSDPRTKAERGVWGPVWESGNEAFFAVGYGATRRVESPEKLDMATRGTSGFLRGQRLQSLFQDAFSLIPLSTWLPRLENENKGRFTQVVHLLDRLLKPGRYTFTRKMGRGHDYQYAHSGLEVPFQALSDGYRAFIGWVADMLFHVCFGATSGKRLDESRGIILVDEIDLHLHPQWQMQVIETIAKALPRMQFILTSHSPLVASSLEWMNIITMKVPGQANRTVAQRLPESIHGLDADQVLISDYFGLKTTRAASKTRQLDELTLQAARGDNAAAERLIAKLAQGMEETG